METLIGFANTYYTLWSYSVESVYQADAYGNLHPVGNKQNYFYQKNISKDIEKVKKLYPGVKIDESLKGKSRSFSKNNDFDMPEGYFWGGKYYGKKIDEILESDFQYCLWSIRNYEGSTSEYIYKHPIYLAYLEQLKQEEQSLIDSVQTLKVGDKAIIDFTSNGRSYNDSTNVAYGLFGDVEVRVLCQVRKVNSLYPYLMPIIDGKAQRTNNKSIEVEVTDVIETVIGYDNKIIQTVKVK